ncbi:MAG: NPXTG-anchored protein [Ruminococcus sp.]|nr:NPXTG-anchored protein [Ruminococcus sp.]
MKLSKITAAFAAVSMSLTVMSTVSLADDSDIIYSTADLNNGSKNVMVKDLSLDADGSFKWICDANKAGYDVDTSAAKVVIEITPDADITEGTTVFTFFDTADGTEYHIDADDLISAGTVDTYAASFDELEHLAKSILSDDNEKNNAFVGDLRLCTAGTVSIYISGAKYTKTASSSETLHSSSIVYESSSSKAAPDSSEDTSAHPDNNSSKPANTASGTNPSTGSAALTVVCIALAGAAAVTAKKKK